jgi:hypothetical protein
VGVLEGAPAVGGLKGVQGQREEGLDERLQPPADRRRDGRRGRGAGDSACPLDDENHGENARFRARVCLAKYARRGGKRLDVIEPTCGGWFKSRF